jgi:hypothetical protein
VLEATELDVRIAVNTGEVLVDLDSHAERGEGMVTGNAVNGGGDPCEGAGLQIDLAWVRRHLD